MAKSLCLLRVKHGEDRPAVSKMLHGDSKGSSDDDDTSSTSRSPRSLQEKWIPEVYAREIELEERLVIELMRRSEVREVCFLL